MNIEPTYKIIDVIIKAQKKARNDHNYLLLMENGQALLEYIPNLISYMVEQEGEYRKFEAKLSDEYTGDKRNSSAYCETQSKATEFYKEWQKAKNFLELIYELVNMSKALGRGINNEFNAS